MKICSFVFLNQQLHLTYFALIAFRLCFLTVVSRFTDYLEPHDSFSEEDLEYVAKVVSEEKLTGFRQAIFCQIFLLRIFGTRDFASSLPFPPFHSTVAGTAL